MSHELRTPLNAVILYSELLQEEAADAGAEDFIPDLEKIRTAGQQLLALINDVLDFSKIEAGKMEVYPETFDLAAMLQDVTTTVQPLVQQKANTLTVHCAADLGTMHSDLTKVRQVLFNLLSNAAKFTEHGTITLTVAREAVAERDWLTFAVDGFGHWHDPRAGRQVVPDLLPRRMPRPPASSAGPGWDWPSPNAYATSWEATLAWRASRDTGRPSPSVAGGTGPGGGHRRGGGSAQARAPRRTGRVPSW